MCTFLGNLLEFQLSRHIVIIFLQKMKGWVLNGRDGY